VHVTNFEVVLGTVDNLRLLRQLGVVNGNANIANGNSDTTETATEAGAGFHAAGGRLSEPSSPAPDYHVPPDMDLPIHHANPMPMLDESGLSEKERMRLAEQRVLPSAPDMEGESHAHAGSAPLESEVVPMLEYSRRLATGSLGNGVLGQEVPAYDSGHERHLSSQATPLAPSAPDFDGIDIPIPPPATSATPIPSAPPPDAFQDLSQHSHSQSTTVAGPSTNGAAIHPLPLTTRRRQVDGVDDMEDFHDLPRYEQ
jgi:hypothetical protein